MTGVDEDPLLARFAAEVRRGETMDLDRAALLLGLFARPDLEVDAYLDRIEAIASGLRAHHGETAPALGALFAAGGFEGNRAEYYDPRNSFLHDVLDRRLGIPISLSVLAIEAGRRAGMVVEGVPFPGHFLVRVGGARDRKVLLDPFSGGQIMGDADLLMLARSATGRMGSLGPAELGAATRRQILSRMLNNLKAIYLRSEAIGLALAVQQRLVVVAPDALVEIRDRGLLLARVGRLDEAEADLRRYLAEEPTAADGEAVRRVADQLRGRRGPVH